MGSLVDWNGTMEDLKATGLCPICRHEIPGLPGEPASARQCVRCSTWYHQDCWDYGGGCAIFGCEPSTRARPCPEPPRERGPFWRETVRFGLRLSAGTLLFLLGSVLGLMGWCVAGPLALPVILILGWCSDTGEHGAGTMAFRRGVLFGPVALVVVPFPVVFASAIPAGLLIALAGLALRGATSYPRLFAIAAAAAIGTLSWSHQSEGLSAPHALLKETPLWASMNNELGHQPCVLTGDKELAQAWRVGLHLDPPARRYWADAESCGLCARWFSSSSARLVRPVPQRILEEMMAQPDAPAGCARSAPNRPMRRLLVMPWRDMRDIEVVRVGDALRVRYGASLLHELLDLMSYSPFFAPRRETRSTWALVLPDAPERVEVEHRGLIASLLGPRLSARLSGDTGRPHAARAVHAAHGDLVRWLAAR